MSDTSVASRRLGISARIRSTSSGVSTRGRDTTSRRLSTPEHGLNGSFRSRTAAPSIADSVPSARFADTVGAPSRSIAARHARTRGWPTSFQPLAAEVRDDPPVEEMCPVEARRFRPPVAFTVEPFAGVLDERLVARIGRRERAHPAPAAAFLVELLRLVPRRELRRAVPVAVAPPDFPPPRAALSDAHDSSPRRWRSSATSATGDARKSLAARWSSAWTSSCRTASASSFSTVSRRKSKSSGPAVGESDGDGMSRERPTPRVRRT
jgi:hypothetical protein